MVRKNNAIFFAVNDGYSFALASVLMDIKRNSANILENTDIIVLHDGIKYKNRQALKKITNNIFFLRRFIFLKNYHYC